MLDISVLLALCCAAVCLVVLGERLDDVCSLGYGFLVLCCLLVLDLLV